MNQRGSEIPGLFGSENKNIDWSQDTMPQDPIQQQQQHGDPNSEGNQNNMILLGGNSLLGDLAMEKDNLDKSFVHSHRLLDIGEKMYSY